MFNSNKVVLFLLILLNAACTKNQQTRQPVSLTGPIKITQFDDTTFFGEIWGMERSKSSIYMDDNISQIYQVRPDMKLINRFGQRGKGPGEFTSISDMSFANDSLYTYDRTEAKILVYNDESHFVREVRVTDNSGANIAVDNRSRIFLSTPDQNHLITELDAHGHKIRAFGQNTVRENSDHFLRNERMLFIRDSKLIAVAKSEPLVEVYNLDGKLINKMEIDRPEIHSLIARVKKENKGPLKHPHFKMVSLLFTDAAIYRNDIYLMMAMHREENTNTWKHKFTYLFKYKLEKNGHLAFVRAFKLFRSDQHKLLYGFRVEAVADHKLVVYDLMGKNLLVFNDKRL